MPGGDDLFGSIAGAETLLHRLTRELTAPPDRDWERKRQLWRTDMLAWFSDRCGIDHRTLRWSAYGGAYDEHHWDGHRDPLAEAAEALADGRDVAIESATATGKTFFGAGALCWFLECWEGSQVITIAPKGDQLKLHIWKEIDSWFWPRLRARYPVATLTTLKLRMRGGIDESWTATGFPVAVRAGEDAATRAQGFHAEHMMFITEETPGIEQAVMKAIKNTCTAPHNIRLALGNPDDIHDSLHQLIEKEPTVIHVRISALDHPNIVLKDPGIVPGAVSQKSIDERRIAYGEGSRLYASRVRGICPAQASDALINYTWIKAAQARYGDASLRDGPAAMGVDVANSENGDQGAVARGIGACCLQVSAAPCPDANVLGDEVRAEAELTAVIPRYIGVDVVGVGVGTFNELKRQGWNVTALSSGSRAPWMPGKEKFLNLRAAMYWKAREDLMRGNVSLPPDDDELMNDLTVPTWTTRGGKIIIEPKENIIKRLGRSPNKGDAFVYWNWVRDNPVAVTGHAGLSPL